MLFQETPNWLVKATKHEIKCCSFFSVSAINNLWFQITSRNLFNKFTSKNFSSGNFCLAKGFIEVNYREAIRQISLSWKEFKNSPYIRFLLLSSRTVHRHFGNQQLSFGLAFFVENFLFCSNILRALPGEFFCFSSVLLELMFKRTINQLKKFTSNYLSLTYKNNFLKKFKILNDVFYLLFNWR